MVATISSSSIVIPDLGLLGRSVGLSSTLSSVTRLIIPRPRLLLPSLGATLLPSVVAKNSAPPPLLEQLLLALDLTLLAFPCSAPLMRLDVGDSLLQLLAQLGDGGCGSVACFTRMTKDRDGDLLVVRVGKVCIVGRILLLVLFRAIGLGSILPVLVVRTGCSLLALLGSLGLGLLNLWDRFGLVGIVLRGRDEISRSSETRRKKGEALNRAHPGDASLLERFRLCCFHINIVGLFLGRLLLRLGERGLPRRAKMSLALRAVGKAAGMHVPRAWAYPLREYSTWLECTSRADRTTRCGP